MNLDFNAGFFYPLMLIGMALLLIPSARPVGVRGWSSLIVGILCGIWGVVLFFQQINVSA